MEDSGEGFTRLVFLDSEIHVSFLYLIKACSDNLGHLIYNHGLMCFFCPDTIFVRAYESRMDLLRAVIIGAEGTPYHDGLFFFDVLFPDNYPHVPPVCIYYLNVFIANLLSM